MSFLESSRYFRQCFTSLFFIIEIRNHNIRFSLNFLETKIWFIIHDVWHQVKYVSYLGEHSYAYCYEIACWNSLLLLYKTLKIKNKILKSLRTFCSCQLHWIIHNLQLLTLYQSSFENFNVDARPVYDFVYNTTGMMTFAIDKPTMKGPLDNT